MCLIIENMAEIIEDKLKFGDENVDFTMDVLEDQLNHLGDEIEKLKLAIHESEHLPGRFVNKFHIIFLTRLCRLLNQPPSVKFHAIELFDIFMRKHIPDVLKQAKSCYKDRWVSTWAAVLERISSQMVLRMLSCIQIASKIRNQETSTVKIGGILFLIRKISSSFTTNSIITSELRVLKTVDFKINQKTPLDYLETLLEILSRNDPGINASKLYSTSLKILDVAICERTELYATLYQRLTGNQEPISMEEQRRWKLNEVDFIILSVSIISCSAYLLNPCSYVRLVSELHKIVNIPQDDIMDFTIVLIDYILERSNGVPRTSSTTCMTV